MYASRTGTKRNLDAMRAAGWRLLVSATGAWRHEGFAYCLDNGAWTHRHLPFDPRRFEGPKSFEGLVDKFGEGADFIVAPDIVGGGLQSLEFSLSWLPRLPGLRLIGVQDGMVPEDVRPHLGPTVGIAVGGTTDDPAGNWKEQSLRGWGQLARETGCYLHVLRINSVRKIHLCQDAGAHSCDGKSASMYSVELPKLDQASRQIHMWGTR